VLVTLQFIATLANLYLAALNADIIDKGVVRGDTGYTMKYRVWVRRTAGGSAR
jgi:ATP-binding cassette subfamily B protein